MNVCLKERGVGEAINATPAERLQWTEKSNHKGGDLEELRPDLGTEFDIWPRIRKSRSVLNKPGTFRTSKFILSFLNTGGEFFFQIT